MIAGSESSEGTPKKSSKEGNGQGEAHSQGASSNSSARTNGNASHARSGGDRQGGGQYGDRQYGDRGGFNRDRDDRPKPQAMEVYVENNIEKAMKVLKRKLIKEGLFKELKSRRYYEKPSEKKKRKEKDSIKKARKEEARAKKNPFLFS